MNLNILYTKVYLVLRLIWLEFRLLGL